MEPFENNFNSDPHYRAQGVPIPPEAQRIGLHAAYVLFIGVALAISIFLVGIAIAAVRWVL